MDVVLICDKTDREGSPPEVVAPNELQCGLPTAPDRMRRDRVGWRHDSLIDSCLPAALSLAICLVTCTGWPNTNSGGLIDNQLRRLGIDGAGRRWLPARPTEASVSKHHGQAREGERREVRVRG